MVEQDPEKVAIAEEQKDIEEMLGNASNIVELVSGVDYDGKVENMTPLEKAKYDLALIFSMNSYYYMYLRSQGVDVKSHKITEEMARIKTASNRIKEMQEKTAKRTMSVDAKAAHRMVKHELWQPPRKSNKRSNANPDVVMDEDWDKDLANQKDKVGDQIEADR